MIEAVATIFLGLVGLWLGNNYRRQMRTALTPLASEAYGRLWDVTGIADPADRRPLFDDERERLAAGMTKWYFEGGAGMYLPSRSRSLFFTIIENLNGKVANFTPEMSRRQIESAPGKLSEVRGCVCKRQISLLRTQLKNDMTLYYKTSTFHHLRSDERDLLDACDIRPGLSSLPVALLARPARGALSVCYCGTCAS